MVEAKVERIIVSCKFDEIIFSMLCLPMNNTRNIQKRKVEEIWKRLLPEKIDQW